MKDQGRRNRLSAIARVSAGLACCLLLLFSRAAFAAFSGADKGTAAGQFLKLGAGARASGMGEAYSAAADEASAVYWNPAALTRIDGFSMTLMHAALLADISYDFFGYGRRLGDNGALGVGVQYLSMPAFHETDTSGFETGAGFNPRDTCLTLSYAHALDTHGDGSYSVGVSGKLIRSGLEKTASTFAMDIGAAARPFGGALQLAVVAQNLGGKLKFERRADPLPLNIKLGGALWLNRKWLIGADVNFPADNSPYAALGTEYRVAYGADAGFTARAGFNSRALGDLTGLSGVSAGGGIDYRLFSLDYAFVPFGTLGMTHRFSVTFGFSGHTRIAADDQETGHWGQKMQSADWEERLAAVYELGKAKAVNPLLELLDDENDNVCGAAAITLGRLRDRRALAPLIERLGSESAYVRASAAKALGYLQDRGAGDVLAKALDDDSPEVRQAAKSALGRMNLLWRQDE